jgi:hypothetical protein
MTFLFEIGDQELGDGRVIIDKEELDSIAGEDFHRLFLYNYYNEYKHYPCQPGYWAGFPSGSSNFLFGV